MVGGIKEENEDDIWIINSIINHKYVYKIKKYKS